MQSSVESKKEAEGETGMSQAVSGKGSTGSRRFIEKARLSFVGVKTSWPVQGLRGGFPDKNEGDPAREDEKNEESKRCAKKSKRYDAERYVTEFEETLTDLHDSDPNSSDESWLPPDPKRAKVYESSDTSSENPTERPIQVEVSSNTLDFTVNVLVNSREEEGMEGGITEGAGEREIKGDTEDEEMPGVEESKEEASELDGNGKIQATENEEGVEGEITEDAGEPEVNGDAEDEGLRAVEKSKEASGEVDCNGKIHPEENEEVPAKRPYYNFSGYETLCLFVLNYVLENRQ